MLKRLILVVVLAGIPLSLLSGCGGSDSRENRAVSGNIGTAKCYACHSDIANPAGLATVFGDTGSDLPQVNRAAREGWLNGPHGNYESVDSSNRKVDLAQENTGFPYFGYSGLGTDPKCTTECHDPLGEGKQIARQYSATGNARLGKADRPVIGCESCHGGGEKHNGIGALPFPKPDPDRCAQCHNSKFDHLQYHPEGGSIAEDYKSSPHSRSINSHNYITGSTTDVSARCSRCHTDEGAKEYIKVVNGTETYEGLRTAMNGKPDIANAANVQCRTCHDGHNPFRLLSEKASGLPSAWSAGFKTCTACHQLLKTDGTRNAEAYHDPAVNPRGDVDEIITDTHYDNPATSVIEGYIINPAATHNAAAKNTNSGSCPDCHNQHNADNTINRQWAKSAHGGFIMNANGTIATDVNGVTSVTTDKAPAWVYYDFKAADRQACQRCHTSTGYRNMANDPLNYNPANNVFVASEQQKEMLYCWACHTSNKGALRNPGAFTAPYRFKGTFAQFPDLGASNVCIPCHSGRESGESLDTITDFSNASFKNPHYMAAAGLMYVKQGFTTFIDPNTPVGSSTYGKSLTSTEDGGAISSTHRKLGTVAINGDSHNTDFFVPGNLDSGGPCTTCHMSTKQHTLAIDGAAFTNVCSKCHTSEGEVTLTPENFRELFVEEQAIPFENALNIVITLLKNTYTIEYDSAVNPYFFKAGMPHVRDNAVKDWTIGGTLSQAEAKKLMGACFNLNLLKRDPAAYAHARTYTRRLIYDSIDFLDDRAINMSTGATAQTTFPSIYVKGPSANDPSTTESMKYLNGYSRSSGAWNTLERP